MFLRAALPNIINKPVSVQRFSFSGKLIQRKPLAKDTFVKNSSQQYISFGLAPAVEQQIKNSISKNYISFDEKILDGYRLFDGSVKYQDHEHYSFPYYTPFTEILVVDRQKDSVLRETINEAKIGLEALKSQEPLEKVKYLKNFINWTFFDFTDDLSIKKVRAHTKEEIPLGQFIKEGTGVCRHKALLFKVLVDDLLAKDGVKADFVKGYLDKDGSLWGHDWNELILPDNRKVLYDVHQDLGVDISDPASFDSATRFVLGFYAMNQAENIDPIKVLKNRLVKYPYVDLTQKRPR